MSVKNNGTPVEISGPLQADGGGAVRLHADQIRQNGDGEKALMALIGKSLADYAHFQNNDALSAQGNSLYIYPDLLLNLSGPVTGVTLEDTSMTLIFASQPCQ